MTKEHIEPMIPGNHIEDWQKTRKKQWKFVRPMLKDGMYQFGRTIWENIPEIKEDYLANDLTGDYHPKYWEPAPLMGMWLSPDQSEACWNEIWDEFVTDRQSAWFFRVRERFLTIAHDGLTHASKSEGYEYGAFGGLEKRLLDVFVRSKIYTDETIDLGGKAQRLIPWKSAIRTYQAILSKNTSFFNVGGDGEGNKTQLFYSPHSPYQWLHEMFISTFEHDIENAPEYEQTGDITCMKSLVCMLDDKPQFEYHPNHIIAGQKMIDIFEDETAPKYLRELWINVRDGKIK